MTHQVQVVNIPYWNDDGDGGRFAQVVVDVQCWQGEADDLKMYRGSQNIEVGFANGNIVGQVWCPVCGEMVDFEEREQ